METIRIELELEVAPETVEEITNTIMDAPAALQLIHDAMPNVTLIGVQDEVGTYL